MTGALSTIQNIYYRGSLEYRNYICSCYPFSRKFISTDTDGDWGALHRLISCIGQWKHGALYILIIPYGEAMIRQYCREGIIRPIAIPHVAGVSCQTNLSFPVSRFLDKAEETRANVTEIKFWGSYHPETADVTDLASKVERLHVAGIEACAGVVGDPSAKEQIRRLRPLLSPSVYLFMSVMQGLREPFSEEDVRLFNEMDNLFNYDRWNAEACLNNCSGGRKSLSVDWEGGMHACPRSGVRAGNLYDDSASLFQPSCLREVCDCCIVFSNLRDTPLRRMMGEGVLWCIPERKKARAVFLDIDGTLTDVQGRVPGRIAPTPKYMSGRLPLYPSIALPMVYAKKRLGGVFDLFSGGVFVDGGFLCYENTVKYVLVEHSVVSDFPGCRTIRYTRKGEIFKYVVLASTVREAARLSARLEGEVYQLYQEGWLLTVVDNRMGKKNGLMTPCLRLGVSSWEVLAVGSTIHDWLVMSVAGCLCVVMDAEEKLKKPLGYVSNPDSIPVLFDVWFYLATLSTGFPPVYVFRLSTRMVVGRSQAVEVARVIRGVI